MAQENTASKSSSTSTSVKQSGPVPSPPAITPEVPQAPVEQLPPGGAPLPPMPKNQLYAALSSGFAKAAVGHFGRMAAELLDDPTVVGYYDEIGSDVKQALHDRWNQRDFENFRTQELDPLRVDLQGMMERRTAQMNAINNGQVIDPATGEVLGEIDPQSIEAVGLKQNIERDSMGAFQKRTEAMMEAAMRHGNNPLVDQFMAQFMTNQSQAINNIISPATKGIGPKEKAEIDLLKAQRLDAQASARQRNEQTKNLAKDSRDLSKMSVMEMYESVDKDPDRLFDLLESTEQGRNVMDRHNGAVATRLGREFMEQHSLDPAIPENAARRDRYLAEPKQQERIRDGGRKEMINSNPALQMDLRRRAAANPDSPLGKMLQEGGPDTKITTPLTPPEVNHITKGAWVWMNDEIQKKIDAEPNITIEDLTAWAITDLTEDFIRNSFIPGTTNAKQKQEIRNRLKRLIRADRAVYKKRLKGKVRRGAESAGADIRSLVSGPAGVVGAGLSAVGGFGSGLFGGETEAQAAARAKRKKTILEGK